MRPFGGLLIMFCVFFWGAHATYAAGATTIQAFSFGEFIIMDNDAAYTITANVNGTSSFSGAALVEIVSPQHGIYDITGLPVNTAIVSVVVTQVSPLISGALSFQMSGFQETHDATTSAGGVARVEVGGTTTASGNSTPYPDRTYAGSIDITLNF